MAPFFPLGKALALSFAIPRGPKGPEGNINLHHHVSVCSPYSPLAGVTAAPTEWRPQVSLSTPQDEIESSEQECTSQRPDPKHESLERLCLLLGASPSNLLYLSTAEDGERGVYLKTAVQKDDVILRIPLSSCLQDDEPPSWFAPNANQMTEDPYDHFVNHYNPSSWATRLGASLLDIHLRAGRATDQSKLQEGLSLWMTMLPNKDFLRASLPVHWSEETISAAKCTALELAVDAAYFTRAEAVADISMRLRERLETKGDIADETLNSLCHNALDVVQTRTCRVEREDGGGQWGPPLRVLAPIFDFINHGSSRCNHEGQGCANAMFRLEGGGATENSDAIVVRAIKHIAADDEVLIDYGDSARPAWRCLASYGFVPEYRFLDSEEEVSDDEGIADECVAELYLDGARFEVGPSTVPFEMVAAAAAAQMAEESGGLVTSSADTRKLDEQQGDTLLTPSVALRIAKRVSDVAFLLLLEPELDIGDDEDRDKLSTPEAVIAAKLAASLRWSQHQVLLACAVGLRDFAARQQTV